MAKVTTVILLCQDYGVRKEFPVEQAENILRMRNSGWQIPEDSQYEFKDGIISTRDKGKGQQA